MEGKRYRISAVSIGKKMEIAKAGCARIHDAITNGSAGEGDAAGRQQRNDQVRCWPGSDIVYAEAERHIFMPVNHSVSWSAAFGYQSCAAIAEYRQLTTGNSYFPDASSVSSDA